MENANSAQVKVKKERMERKYWKYIMLFGLFEISWAVIWGAYNNYFPITLQAGGPDFNKLGVSSALGFGIGAFMTGIIMTIDNFFGMIFAPFWGAMSDQAKSRKRIVVISGTISALLIILLPFCYSSITPETSGKLSQLIVALILTIAVTFLVILFWSIGVSSNGGMVFATIPSKFYNRVSSFTMLFGGIGFVISMFVTSMLYKIHYSLPYLFGGVVLLLTMLLYGLLLKEPQNITYSCEKDIPDNIAKNPIKSIIYGLNQFDGEQKAGVLKVYLFKVCGIFGIMGFQTYASSWGVNSLGVNEATVSMMTAVYFLGYLIAAIPVGVAADKLGRKKTAYLGLFIMILGGVVLYFVALMPVVLVTLFILGIGNSILDVIALPLATEYAPNKKSMGILFSVATSIGRLSTVISVPLIGAIIEATGNNYGSIFVAMSVAAFIGIFFLNSVKPYSKKVELD